jgi:hypothetical protein
MYLQARPAASCMAASKACMLHGCKQSLQPRPASCMAATSKLHGCCKLHGCKLQGCKQGLQVQSATKARN